MARPQEAHTIKEIRAGDPQELMRRYKSTGDIGLRNQLVMHYIRHVNIAIYSIKSLALSRVPFEDFFNQGVLALMDCIERYDPERGEASFDTYCYTAIRGAVIKYMRRQCWLPNRLWETRSKIMKQRSELEQSLQREPTDDELAEAMGITRQKLEQSFAELDAVDTASFEEMLEESYDGVGIGKMPEAPDSEVDRRLLRQELDEALGQAIESLPEKERQIITLYYYENLNLREIGEVLGLSQQRISQCRASALERLRGALKNHR